MYPDFWFPSLFTYGFVSYRYGLRRVAFRGCAFLHYIGKEQGLI